MSRMPHVTLGHCSVGCNQLAECLDWGAAGLIAYGAHNQAVVYDPEVPAANRLSYDIPNNASMYHRFHPSAA
jgi:hypothetical protein